jgi:hypothetical protein
MVDIPDAISEHTFLHFFGLLAELDEVVNVLLKVLVEEFLWVKATVPEGSLIAWACRITDSRIS